MPIKHVPIENFSRKPTTAAQDAIATADAHLNNAVLPTYSELLGLLREMAPRFAGLRELGGFEVSELSGRVRNVIARHDATMAGDFKFKG